MEEKLVVLEQEPEEQNPDWWAAGHEGRPPGGAWEWNGEAKQNQREKQGQA